MGFLAYLWKRAKERTVFTACHDIARNDGQRDDDERRDEDERLEEHLREGVRRYEDDLRELAKT